MSRYTHFILKDDGNSFTTTWTASYGSEVTGFEVDISGNLYIAGYGRNNAGSNTSSIQICASDGSLIRNLLIDTSSIGLSNNNITTVNNITAMVIDNSQSLYVANRRVLKYPSGSSTPDWSGSFFQNLQNRSGSIMNIKLDQYKNIYAIGFMHGIPNNGQVVFDINDVIIQKSLLPPLSQSLNIVKWKYQSDQSGQDQYIREWSGSFTPARIPSSSNLVAWSEGATLFKNLSWNPSNAKITSSQLDYNGSYNAVLVNPTSSTVRSVYNFAHPGFRAIVDSGSTYIASAYFKASGSLGSQLSSIINFATPSGPGGRNITIITSSNFAETGYFQTQSGQPSGFRVDNLEDGWNRIVIAYKVSASVSSGPRTKELHTLISNTAMSMYWYGLSYVSSSTADTASAINNYTGDSAIYVPNIANAIYVTGSFATNHTVGSDEGYIPVEGKYDILVDKDQNIYLSGPAVTSSNNSSIIKLKYDNDNYTLSASYNTTPTTISNGLALYEKTEEETLIFQISRADSQGIHSSSSINVFDEHLNLKTSFVYTSSIKAADLLDNIQVSPNKDLYLTTKIPARTIKYKWTGEYNWELQPYTHTFGNKINYF